MAVRVTGNTFDHRERLKQLGGRWDAAAKNWIFEYPRPKDVAELKNLPGCLVVEAADEPTPSVPDGTPSIDDDPVDWMKKIAERHAEKNKKDGNTKTVIYGDDQTYFNYFQSKNPLSFFGFSTLSEMVKFIEKIPARFQEVGWEKSGGDWYGTRDMKQALEIARNGWSDGVKKAAELLEYLNLENAVERRRKYSVAGGYVNVGRMLSGNPAHMVKRPKQDGRQTITLFVENTASAYIKAEMLTIRAAVVAAFADILEMRGYSCQIVSVTTQARMNDLPGAQTAVTLKHAGEKLNLDDLVFALGHPSFLRRFNFACVSQAVECREIWNSQGMPRSAFGKDDLKRNEFYIRHLTENVKGGNFLEIAKKIIPMIKPHRLPLEIK